MIFRLSELQPPVRKPANIPASESEATKIANWRSRAEANLVEWERYHCNGWWSSDKDSDCADVAMLLATDSRVLGETGMEGNLHD